MKNKKVFDPALYYTKPITKKEKGGRRRKQFIGGLSVSKTEALKGLGKEKTWPKQSKKIYTEFRKKPAQKDKGEPLELL